jgi:dipeptidase
MCDTFVAMPGHTGSRHLIFGKNSDREPDEAQAIVRIPAMQHPEHRLPCTYITIPQVRETFSVILSKPFQMWGAEMGVNEHGLVIGNEAVFTRIRFPKKNTGLSGMDMLRLALERCRSAAQALELITDLLADYSQDACGGYQNRRFFYANSFLIADVKEAWVLETAGHHWAAQRVNTGFRSISNILTIEEDYDLISREAVSFAQRKGWIGRGKLFSFKGAFSDWLYTMMARGRQRKCITTEWGNACAGILDVQAAMNILTTHHPPGDDFLPSRCTTASICMHATGLTNPSNTTGSMIAEIRPDGQLMVWLTGTSLPCLSVWKPFFFSAGGEVWKEEALLAEPGPKPDASLWWQAEAVHRKLVKDYRRGHSFIQSDRTSLQEKLLTTAAELWSKQAKDAELEIFSQNALKGHLSLLKDWSQKLA